MSSVLEFGVLTSPSLTWQDFTVEGAIDETQRASIKQNRFLSISRVLTELGIGEVLAVEWDVLPSVDLCLPDIPLAILLTNTSVILLSCSLSDGEILNYKQQNKFLDERWFLLARYDLQLPAVGMCYLPPPNVNYSAIFAPCDLHRPRPASEASTGRRRGSGSFSVDVKPLDGDQLTCTCLHRQNSSSYNFPAFAVWSATELRLLSFTPSAALEAVSKRVLNLDVDFNELFTWTLPRGSEEFISKLAASPDRRFIAVSVGFRVYVLFHESEHTERLMSLQFTELQHRNEVDGIAWRPFALHSSSRRFDQTAFRERLALPSDATALLMTTTADGGIHVWRESDPWDEPSFLECHSSVMFGDADQRALTLPAGTPSSSSLSVTSSITGSSVSIPNVKNGWIEHHFDNGRLHWGWGQYSSLHEQYHSGVQGFHPPLPHAVKAIDLVDSADKSLGDPSSPCAFPLPKHVVAKEITAEVHTLAPKGAPDSTAPTLRWPSHGHWGVRAAAAGISNSSQPHNAGPASALHALATVAGQALSRASSLLNRKSTHDPGIKDTASEHFTEFVRSVLEDYRGHHGLTFADYFFTAHYETKGRESECPVHFKLWRIFGAREIPQRHVTVQQCSAATWNGFSTEGSNPCIGSSALLVDRMVQILSPQIAGSWTPSLINSTHHVTSNSISTSTTSTGSFADVAAHSAAQQADVSDLDILYCLSDAQETLDVAKLPSQFAVFSLPYTNASSGDEAEGASGLNELALTSDSEDLEEEGVGEAVKPASVISKCAIHGVDSAHLRGRIASALATAAAYDAMDFAEEHAWLLPGSSSASASSTIQDSSIIPTLPRQAIRSATRGLCSRERTNRMPSKSEITLFRSSAIGNGAVEMWRGQIHWVDRTVQAVCSVGRAPTDALCSSLGATKLKQVPRKLGVSFEDLCTVALRLGLRATFATASTYLTSKLAWQRKVVQKLQHDCERTSELAHSSVVKGASDMDEGVSFTIGDESLHPHKSESPSTRIASNLAQFAEEEMSERNRFLSLWLHEAPSVEATPVEGTTADSKSDFRISPTTYSLTVAPCASLVRANTPTITAASEFSSETQVTSTLGSGGISLSILRLASRLVGTSFFSASVAADSEIIAACSLDNSNSNNNVTKAYSAAQRVLAGAKDAASLDAFGLQFLASVVQHGRVSWTDCLFGLWSDSQDALVATCVPTSLSWQSFSDLKIPVWLRSATVLEEVIERIAKTAYLASDKDPFAAVLPYLMLGPSKFGTLKNLFRISHQHQKVHSFLQNDFAEERWKKAASRNAFALLGQHRFEAAAGFFLLAGRPSQAIKLCTQELANPMLALAIARLSYYSSSPIAQKYGVIDMPGIAAAAAVAVKDILKMVPGVVASESTPTTKTSSPSAVLRRTGPRIAGLRAGAKGFGFDDEMDSVPSRVASADVVAPPSFHSGVSSTPSASFGPSGEGSKRDDQVFLASGVSNGLVAASPCAEEDGLHRFIDDVFISATPLNADEALSKAVFLLLDKTKTLDGLRAILRSTKDCSLELSSFFSLVLKLPLLKQKSVLQILVSDLASTLSVAVTADDMRDADYLTSVLANYAQFLCASAAVKFYPGAILDQLPAFNLSQSTLALVRLDAPPILATIIAMKTELRQAWLSEFLLQLCHWLHGELSAFAELFIETLRHETSVGRLTPNERLVIDTMADEHPLRRVIKDVHSLGSDLAAVFTLISSSLCSDVQVSELLATALALASTHQCWNAALMFAYLSSSLPEGSGDSPGRSSGAAVLDSLHSVSFVSWPLGMVNGSHIHIDASDTLVEGSILGMILGICPAQTALVLFFRAYSHICAAAVALEDWISLTDFLLLGHKANFNIRIRDEDFILPVHGLTPITNCRLRALAGKKVSAVDSEMRPLEIWLRSFLKAGAEALAALSVLKQYRQQQFNRILHMDKFLSLLESWASKAVSAFRSSRGVAIPDAIILKLRDRQIHLRGNVQLSRLDIVGQTWGAYAGPLAHILSGLLGPLAKSTDSSSSSRTETTDSGASKDPWWMDAELLGVHCLKLSDTMQVAFTIFWQSLGGCALFWLVSTERRALTRALNRLRKGSLPDIKSKLKLELHPKGASIVACCPLLISSDLLGGGVLAPVLCAKPSSVNPCLLISAADAGIKHCEIKKQLPKLPKAGSTGDLTIRAYKETGVAQTDPGTHALGSKSPAPLSAAAAALTAGLRSVTSTGSLGALLIKPRSATPPTSPLSRTASSPTRSCDGDFHTIQAPRSNTEPTDLMQPSKTPSGNGSEIESRSGTPSRLFSQLKSIVTRDGHSEPASADQPAPQQQQAAHGSESSNRLYRMLHGSHAPHVPSRLGTSSIVAGPDKPPQHAQADKPPRPILRSDSETAHYGTVLPEISGGSTPGIPRAAVRGGDNIPKGKQSEMHMILATDRYEFTLPFTLPAATIDQHPNAPLYLRGGPDGMVAVCSVTLEPAHATAASRIFDTTERHQYQFVHRLNTIYCYETLTSVRPPLRVGGSVKGIGGKPPIAADLSVKKLSSWGRKSTTKDMLGGEVDGSSPILGADNVNLDEQVTRVRWSPDGKTVLASFASGIVRLWDAATPERPSHTLATSASHKLDPGEEREDGTFAHERPVWSATDVCTLSSSGKLLAASAAPLFPAHQPKRPLYTKSDGEAIARPPTLRMPSIGSSTDWTHTGWGVHIYDVRKSDSAVMTAARFPEFPGVASLYFDESKLCLVAGCQEGSLLVFDLRMGKIIVQVPGVPQHSLLRADIQRSAESANAAHSSPRPWKVGVSPENASVLSVDGMEARPDVLESFAHAGSINHIVGHPNARVIGTAGRDGEVKAWSLDDLTKNITVAKLHSGRGVDTQSTWQNNSASSWADNVGVSGLFFSEEYLVTTGFDGAAYALHQLW